MHDIGNPQISAAPSPAAPAQQPPQDNAQDTAQEEELEALAKPGTLKEKGILTEAEFAAKKAELLGRL